MVQWKDRTKIATQALPLRPGLFPELHCISLKTMTRVTGLLWGLNEILWAKVLVNDKFRKEQNHYGGR